MEISQGRVATIHYTLSDDSGQVLDRSTPDAPLSYLHGAGNIVPGLEHALDGKRVGETLTADVVPEQGYGPRHEQLIQQVPREAFPTDVEVVPGVQFEARTQQGPVLVTVTEVGPEQVTVDGNHPLAGQTLHFAVEVIEVREATTEELNEGQVASVAA
ncbi:MULTISPECIES: FKBP-type peptidyl-prolyl cis-trans isomerase [Xanthomonas]|jgi:FKBP-type peptidyl-prolyl cis-trans isomerase SlyD|uniref:FKBP-type peptidyl-prolyl cis-trans isomerase n=1 Tax=Xanthomonas TaxID=338 RepID=UPI000467D294|nr:peptidylprolyl isomerase [Xanthomonas arboricola]KPN07890.1 peptidylprolyl isomerase [Xanthomonas arboricola]MBB5675704.1 FKBP-type peptidyl-prolyl cis-trans isomerase SlyD [Xanthomonas arboricola]MCC8668384.1 peptidylprolyl isomerase [Xanthomonas arboricola]NJB92280.1 FKBP-type peptidyl-prolyl cis-trans isomerase SlyD [Xanthomonas arboricola]